MPDLPESRLKTAADISSSLARQDAAACLEELGFATHMALKIEATWHALLPPGADNQHRRRYIG